MPRLAALAAVLSLLAALPAGAEPVDTGGTLLFHGNYCGPGNRGMNKRPIDALDAACRRHDQCTPDAGLPACACNARLHDQAQAIARDPRQPMELREVADFTAQGALALPCR